MRVKVYTKTGTLQMREDAMNMTLNEFMAKYGTSEQIVDVWTAKQVQALETMIGDL